MTVLVTGGSGFLGTWVIKELLAHDCDVVVFDRAEGGERWANLLGERTREITFVGGDLLNPDSFHAAFEARHIERVIHLAAWLTPDCQRDPLRGCEINVLGTMRVLESIRAHKEQIKSFVYTSSFAVYEDREDAAETSPREPGTFYGVFKLACEMIARQYWLHFGIASVGVRPAVVFGPERDNGLSAAPSLAARALALGEDFAFPFSGTTRLEWVGDTARAIVRAALEIETGSQVVELNSPCLTMEDFVILLHRLRPESAIHFSIGGPPLPYSNICGEHTIEHLFPDWQTTPLEDALCQTIEFYERVNYDRNQLNQL